MKVFSKRKNGRERAVYFFGRRILAYRTRPVFHSCVAHGKGNRLPASVPKSLEVTVWGDDNVLECAEDMIFAGRIRIGTRDCPVRNCRVVIGAGTTAEACDILLLESGSEVLIGEDGLISEGVRIWCSDTHALLSSETGEVTNRGRRIVIGRHCWLGLGASVLKNVELPEGTVVGMHAVVAGVHELAPKCVLAGNPARVVRENVVWDRRRPEECPQ